MLKVVDFIRNNDNWRELLSAEPYHLTIKEEGCFIMLKYSQTASNFHNEIVRECRGLILAQRVKKDVSLSTFVISPLQASEITALSYDPVCIPFFKFGNYGEPYADTIEWSLAQAEEKIDGSLIKVWNYKGEWIVSTNGTIFAENAPIMPSDGIGMNHTYKNYLELFQAAKRNVSLDFESLEPNYTYMFELISSFNRVVVPYDEIDLYHIGTRDNASLKEVEVDIGIKKPRKFLCNCLADVIEMAAKLRYCEEGYVVRDAYFNRIKVKSPAYVAVSHLLNGMNEKRMIELLRTNEISEFLSYFPEYKSSIDKLSSKITSLTEYLHMTLKENMDGVTFESRKEFADIAKKTKYPQFFFQYYDSKVKNAHEWIWSMTSDKILEQLKRLETEEIE